ncbi:MAG: class I SAM-dependent rRNA methyltransferase [Thermodesulfovibrionales bacterium]|nr:class I SAM-dependent rRNA methyltransferase [Thermodesulfovibrionales bacterium]
MVTFEIKKKRVGPVLGFHPWVFSRAIKEIPEGLPAGEPVRLVDPEGKYLASGYFNSYSQIAVRIWGYRDGEGVDMGFFKRRFERAHALRQRYAYSEDTNAFRLVNGEGDLLPGLVVDMYAGWLSVQFHTPGIERWKNEITVALIEALGPQGIFERSDSAMRGRGQGVSGPLHGDVPAQVEIMEHGLRYIVDLKEGQKTGFFLDQRDKRLALRRYVRGERVLNAFSYSGGFTVSALAAGAEHVVSVDSSASAMALARKNVRINGFGEEMCGFVESDVKQYLRNYRAKPFGVIVLDPPAFIKDRRKKAEGIRGYRSINEAALRVLARGGILMSCSCSTHISLEEFRYMLSEAGRGTGRRLQVLEIFGHGIDHPVGVAFTEGEYLKCVVMRAGKGRSEHE